MIVSWEANTTWPGVVAGTREVLTRDGRKVVRKEIGKDSNVTPVLLNVTVFCSFLFDQRQRISGDQRPR